MKTALSALAAFGLLFGAMQAQAADTPSASEHSPGHQMQSGSAPGASENAPPNGASDATPGQQMKESTGPGASQYAPGHNKGAAANAGKTNGSDPSVRQ